MASIKTNIVLNGLNTLSSIVFPLITFPYAARVLLPEGIGTINFLNSIIQYIVLLTSLGIPMYAVKEVAKYRDDLYKRDIVSVEIILLSASLCALGYVSVGLLGNFVPQIHKQIRLFYILSLSIVFNTIGVNWFYQGIEDFKFITIRALIIRTLVAVSLFIFVKKPSDLTIYGFILVGSSVGNNLINFTYLRRYIKFRELNIHELNIRRHLKPSLHVFILNLIISLYVQLNSIMLGFLSGDKEVGYFIAGSRITHIGLMIMTSIGTVMLPRVSSLLKRGDTTNFKYVIVKSLNLTQLLGWPMAIGLIVLATPITLIFCGTDYGPAITVLILNAPIIIFISLTNLMGIQILYPMDKTNIVILSVSGGAVANIVFNLLLIPELGATGAAISTLISEFSVLILQICLGYRYYPFSLKDMLGWRYMITSIIMGVIVFILVSFLKYDWLKLLVGIPIGVLIYFLIMLYQRENLTEEIFITIKSKFLFKGRIEKN